MTIAVDLGRKATKQIKKNSLKINFVLANSVDSDMAYTAFHMGLYCLPEDPFKGFWSSKG